MCFFIMWPRDVILCFFTGYKGRQAVYEVIPLDMELSDCIRKLYDIKAYLNERGIRTLAENAFDLFAQGENIAGGNLSIVIQPVTDIEKADFFHYFGSFRIPSEL